MAVKYEKVRDWVLALPGGQEVMVEEWGHPTLRVNNKMFASGAPGGLHDGQVHPGGAGGADAAQPGVYSMAAYVGRFGWVEVQLSTVDPGELHELVIEAWRRTAPKKLVKGFDLNV
jgi:hypothetical protein